MRLEKKYEILKKRLQNEIQKVDELRAELERTKKDAERTEQLNEELERMIGEWGHTIDELKKNEENRQWQHEKLLNELKIKKFEYDDLLKKLRITIKKLE